MLRIFQKGFCSRKFYSTSSDANYLLNRKREVEILELAAKNSLYPSTFPKQTISYTEFKSDFRYLKPTENAIKFSHTLIGRVTARREASSKLIFLTLRDSDNSTFQIMASKNNFTCDFELMQHVKRGDIVSVSGSPGKTKTGELSLFSSTIQILAPCLHQIPLELEDVETRHRKRHLDFLVNPEKMEIFKMRAKVIQFTRRFLDDRGFLEVETPIISREAGGANAKPFLTHSNALSLDLKLRISPELFLKKLVVGGFDRVYELGKVFRNEGVDTTHNPEFTSCEFYQACANYEDMMSLTEKYLAEMCMSLHGKTEIQIGDQLINFAGPYKRVPFVDAIESKLGHKVPLESDGNAISILTKCCLDNGIQIDRTKIHYPYLLDKLCGHFLESDCVQPTFICDHPVSLSPLAKSHKDRPHLTERFELFVLGKEICNAYTELNDPRVQNSRFESQILLRQSGDGEAQEMDHHFVEALEYGLVPLAGWGCGIDRLVMLMKNTMHIREVLLFPLMKETQKDK
jgi:lysyl-tRNA synthetase class 2